MCGNENISRFSNKKVIIFDLGGTLVRYYNRNEFPAILKKSIKSISNFLQLKYGYNFKSRIIWERVEEENYENGDYQVRPLENRLSNIFRLHELKIDIYFELLIREACMLFLKPIFEVGKIFDDTKPCLNKIREMGFRMGLISNTPWGSPSGFWRKELERHKLNEFFDKTVFCRDIGWRKPAKQIFNYTTELMKVDSEDCLFIGDDPRWDLIGPNNVGMDALIIDRTEEKRVYDKRKIRSLYQLLERL
jgi:putative hydrolase of the HAD superfamily